MTAKDFLDQYLDYKSFWCFDHTINSKPAKIRLRRLNSMLKAFGISKKNINPLIKIQYSISGKSAELSRAKKLSGLNNLEYFEQGEFLHDREENENRELIKRIKDLAMKEVPDIYELKKDRMFSIGWLFNDLMRFRMQIYKIAHPWGGFDEGFDIALFYGIAHQEKLKKLIRDHTGEIDEILCMIIDPAKKEVSEKELIENYKYDSVDLKKIDLKWITDNY